MEGAALVEAVHETVGRGDLPGAMALLREALADGTNPLARELLGGLLLFDDDIAAARRELELAFREWSEAGEPMRAACVAATLADVHAAWLGNPAAGQGWVARARRLLEPVGRCVEQGYVELAIVACEQPDVAQLERAATVALDLAQEFGDPELAVRALADSGYALVVQGRIAAGFARLDEAMAILSAGELHNPTVLGMSYCALLAACDRTGDSARAEQWTRAITDGFLDPNGGRPRVMHTHCRLAYGSVLCATGRLPEGEAALLDALGPEASGVFSHRAEASARLASLRLLQGRVDEAAELLRGLEGRPGACEPLARVHLVCGDLELARAVAERGLTTAGADLLRVGALRALLVEIALADDDVIEAAEHAEALRNLALAADSPLLRADAALAAGRVAAARPDPDAAIASFVEARTHLHPDERPLVSALLCLEHAQVLADAGQRGAALDHARTAIALLDRLGARPLVDRADALLRSLGARARSATRPPTAAVAGLSRREQDVLALLREGLTNPEIGERLFISAKTAEHHVGRILSKLGVRSRAEAAAVATAAALTPPPFPQ